MIDITKKYRTKDGLDVQLVSTAGRGNFPVIGYIAEDMNPFTWTAEGYTYYSSNRHGNDLIEVPEEITRWLNIQNHGGAFLYNTKQEANKAHSEFRIACIEIKFRKGDGI